MPSTEVICRPVCLLSFSKVLPFTGNPCCQPVQCSVNPALLSPGGGGDSQGRVGADPEGPSPSPPPPEKTFLFEAVNVRKSQGRSLVFPRVNTRPDPGSPAALGTSDPVPINHGTGRLWAIFEEACLWAMFEEARLWAMFEEARLWAMFEEACLWAMFEEACLWAMFEEARLWAMFEEARLWAIFEEALCACHLG